jgi:molybdate-binding protein
MSLLAREGLAFAALAKVTPPCPTGPDIAHAVRAGRADCGIATRSVARAANLDFVPLAWERFDLVLRQRDYFLPGPQALFGFLRTRAFAERARELTGYDVATAGEVRRVK